MVWLFYPLRLYGNKTVAVSQFRVCILEHCDVIGIWRPITPQRRAKAVPILQMQPSFTSFWRMHLCYPSWPHISQNSLWARKRRKEERKWRHRVAYINPFAGLGGRNHDVRVKHLVMQPGNAPKTRVTRLTRSLQRTRLQRPQRPGPSKDADPELRHSICLVKTIT